MAKRTGREKSKTATPEARNAPSILDKINLDEIDIKITRLVEKLRGPDNSIISRAVTNCAEKLLERNPKMIKFVGGGHRYTFAEALWVCRTEVEADFLRDYLQGVMQIYDGYYRRLGIKLSSRDLDEVWAKGIEPCWKGMLQTLEDDLNGNYPGQEPSLLQGRMQEFEKRTGHTFRDAENEWREKVEEAVSVEKFGQPNPEFAALGKSERNPDVIAKAIGARVRKSDYSYIYTKMWDWLGAGNKPAEFIRENIDTLEFFLIGKNQAFKMFNRVKRWREKKIEIRRPGPVGPTDAPD